MRKISGLALAALLASCGHGNLKTVKKAETRYQQEFPGRELAVTQLDTLQSVKTLVPFSQERAYALDPRVGVEGDYYVFTVFTPHGTYTAKGMFALAQVCREARTVEMFLTSPQSKALQQAMGEYWSPAKAPRGTMFISPVDSIRGLGRSFHFQYQEWENNYVSPTKKDTASLDGINRAKAAATPAARELAYHLRLDAYSENPALQALFRALTNDRAAAEGLMPEPGEFFIPCGENYPAGRDLVPAWGKKWPAPGGGSAQAERFIRDENGGGILAALRDFYADNFPAGVAEGAALKRLFANTAYSPRQQVYIAWYLANIGAANTDEALNYLGLARTAFRAAYNLAQLEMLHAIHGYYAPVERFAALQNQLGVITRGRQLMVVPLWDHTRQRNNVRHLLMEIRSFGDNYGLRDLHLWFTGDCDKSVIATGEENHIAVRADVAGLDIFRFTTLRALSYRPLAGDARLRGTATVVRDPVAFQERVSRPVPVHKVQPQNSVNGKITIERDPPKWNGRLAIEKPLQASK